MTVAAKSVFVLLFLCLSAYARADCSPGPDQAAFFTDANFQGSCVLRAVGDYPTATAIGLPNDSISSVRVGGNVKVYACRDENFGGTCVVLPADTSYLGDTELGNDALTSAKVQFFAHNFDPRCSNRTGTGRFECTITTPVVSRPEWVYSQVAFAPGDIVYVGGDGCVQTGGSGGTWKRYVNPAGSDADHLYHGLVRIPGGRQAGTDVGNSLTRIEHVVGRPIQIAGDGFSSDELQLHLGYEDDNYDDNGYNNHDDGTEDQCKTSGTNYGGPAFVIVTICRGLSTCDAPESRFAFNVRSNEYDPNGLLYNPHWAWQERPEFHSMSPPPTPNTLLCHNFTKSGPLLALHFYDEPNLPDCTDQAGADTLNQPSDLSPNNIACTLAISFTPVGFSGHINWFPITVSGSVGRISHEGKDDDWTFSVTYGDTAKGSLYYDHPDEPRRFLHAEFDSDETVDHFRSDAWTSLHNAIDDRERISDFLHACQRNSTSNCADWQAASDAAWALSDKLFVGDAIITGLFGIDGEHGEKSELHPVYALATNPCLRGDYKNKHCVPENDPNDDAWLMFVRNRGDEGGCSDQIWSAGFDDYTFRLPWRAGMQAVTVNWDESQFHWSDGSTARPDVNIVAPIFLSTHSAARNGAPLSEQPGVYVTFHLRYSTVIPASDSSASIPFVDGALHLVWTPPNGSAPTDSGVGSIEALPVGVADHVRQKEDSDEDSEALQVALDHLPYEEQKLVLGARRYLSPYSGQPPMPKPGSAAWSDNRSAAIVASGSHRPVAGPVGPATRKNMRDAALFKALCKASHNKPYGLPATACVGSTREQEH